MKLSPKPYGIETPLSYLSRYLNLYGIGIRANNVKSKKKKVMLRAFSQKKT